MIELDRFHAMAQAGDRLVVRHNEDGLPTLEVARQSFKERILSALSYVPLLNRLPPVVAHTNRLKEENQRALASFIAALSQKYGSDAADRARQLNFPSSSGHTPLDQRHIVKATRDAENAARMSRGMASAPLQNTQTAPKTGRVSEMSGFPNLGNTCYANSALKLLIHAYGKERLIQHLQASMPGFRNDALKAAAEHLIGIIRAACESQDAALAQNLLGKFFTALQEHPSFSGQGTGARFQLIGRQNDSHEFLTKLVDVFRLDALEGYALALTPPDDNGMPADPFDENLAFGILHSAHVSGSGGSSGWPLQRIVQNAEISGSGKRHFWVTQDLDKLQRFTLHVNAVTSAGGKLSLTGMDLSAPISLIVYDQASCSPWRVTLEPREAIIHQGAHPHSGHYYAYTKESDGSWTRHDDSQVLPKQHIAPHEQPTVISFAVREKVPVDLPLREAGDGHRKVSDSPDDYQTLASRG